MAYRREGTEIFVNTDTAGDQKEVAITKLASGNFVMLWTGRDGGFQGEGGVKAQLFDVAGSKVGSEFRANQDTFRFQTNPTVTALSDGGFMGFWQQSGLNINYLEGQVFNSAGGYVGGEFQPGSGSSNFDPQLETLSNGNVVMVWWDQGASGSSADGSLSAIYAQILSPSGTVVTPRFFANSTTVGQQEHPSVATLPGGGFVVAWGDGRTYGNSETIGGDGSNTGVRAQLFDNAGARVGPEFLANTTTANIQSRPSVTVLSGGGFVIVWQDASAVGGDTSGFAIKAQIFDAAGAKVGGEILVNTATSGDQIDPAVAALGSGGFLIAWSDKSGEGGDASGYGIKVQEFSASGARIGIELLVNTATSGDQTDPVLEVLAGDRVVVAWTDASGTGGDTSGTSIKAQLLAQLQEINGTDSGETINGTPDGEIINGRGGDDTINAGGGNDEIDGGAGADTMNGGEGNDLYIADDSGDVVVENAGEGGGDEVRTSLTVYQLTANVERLTGTSASAGQALLGNDLDNNINGSSGRDRLEGYGGADTLAGFPGDDTFVVETQADQVLEYRGEGTDTVFSFGDYELAAGSEIEYLSAVDLSQTTPMRLVGNEFNNQLYGNAGRNRLEGGGGFDVLRGFGGDDTYVVDPTNDFIVESVGDGTDIVLSTGNYVLNAGAEVEYLAAVEVSQQTPMRLVGNEFDNEIQGNAGRNRLEGGGGVDVLRGYGGDDTYVVDGPDDVVVELAGEGTDTVYSFGDYTLGAGSAIEYLSAVDHGMTTGIHLTGNELGNQVYGNAGANRLDGGGGRDALIGFDGSDIFAFTTALDGGNVDFIADFAVGSDRIELDDAVFAGLAPGALAAGAFARGSAATEADDRIIYNPETGALLFDADGAGGTDAVQFANLQPGLAELSAADFLVV